MRKDRHARMKLKATPEGLPKVSGVPIEAVLEPHPRSRERPSLAKVNPLGATAARCSRQGSGKA